MEKTHISNDIYINDGEEPEPIRSRSTSAVDMNQSPSPTADGNINVKQDNGNSTNSSKQWLCCSKAINKQNTIQKIALLITAFIMLLYLVYLCISFFDYSINKKQFTEQSNVSTMPAPYIFFEIDSTAVVDPEFSCEYELFTKFDTLQRSVDKSSDVNSTVIDFYLTEDVHDYSGATINGIAANNTAIANSDIGTYITDSDEWIIIHRFSNKKRSMLIIPPSDEVLHVSNPNTYYQDINSNGVYINDDFTNDIGLRIYAACGYGNTSINSGLTQDEVNEDISQTIVWYNIDHLDQLKKYFSDATLNQTFTTLSYTYDFLLGGYMTIMEYEWFAYVNKIKPKSVTGKNFFISSIESTFNLLNVQYNAFVDKGYYDAFYLIIKPNSAGVKVTHVTTFAEHWTSILSSFGGMYGTIAGVVNIVLLYLIWGFTFKNKYYNGM